MDDKEFQDLYKRHAKPLHSYVKKKYHLPKSDADDVIHDIFLEFWNRFKTQGARHTKTYLLCLSTKTVTYNYRQKQSNNQQLVSINNTEDEKHETSAEDEEDNDTSAFEAICDDKAQQEFDDLEIIICLTQIIAQLKRDSSNTHLLNCIQTLKLQAEEHPIKDIAAQIDRTPEATRKYMYQCRKKLKQHPLIQQCWEQRSTQTMSNQDDQHWLNLLAGQPVPDADPQTAREARILRAALLAHADQSTDDNEIPYPAIWQKLSTHLKTEQQPTTRQPTYDPLLALAASLLIAVLIVGKNADPISKSQLPCLNHIVTPQPPTTAAHFQTELQTLGLTTELYQIEPGWRLQTQLPATKPPALENWLTRHPDLAELPQHNLLCINFLTKKPQ